VLPVNVGPEGHASAPIPRQPIVADYGHLAIDDLNSDLDQVSEDVADLAVGMIPDVHASRTGSPEHFRITRLEDSPPGFRLDD